MTVESWSSGPGPNISFIGAEPFTHPHLPHLISSAAEFGCERIRLRTDGGALGISGNASGALHAGVRHIELQMLAGDAPTHDALTGRPGLHLAATEGATEFLRAARESGLDVALSGRVPACRHNTASIVGAVLTLARAGAVTILVDPVDGYELPQEIVSGALRAATVSGAALHGPGISPFSADPWFVLASGAAS
jgi:hypothetical protein